MEILESVDCKPVISLHICSGNRFERLLKGKGSGGNHPAWEAVKASATDARHFPKNVRGASYAVCSDTRDSPAAGLQDLLTF
ncbi:hypothetical protein R1T15_05585 [Mucilaginibacter sp. L3T2-6]|nr:hypothetical protein [Mucilaginibacter sp. L3T2-6]MDV6213955.1 hypothetical protein [Mucilaginibacter sp. L3T2-6]